MTWNNFKRGYRLRHHPLKCAVCDDYRKPELHHIIPASVRPDLAYDDSNFVVLCRLHHLIVGHLGNWNVSNPNVLDDIQRLRVQHGK
jgi:5-methylcytosine-specific restriction endonuclease McrA